MRRAMPFIVGLVICGMALHAEAQDPKQDGPVNASAWQSIDESGEVTIGVRGTLEIPITNLILTSKWEGKSPAVPAQEAIELAEAQLDKCQYLKNRKIEWRIASLTLVPYRQAGKTYWCWIADFEDAKDAGELVPIHVARIAILLNGDVIAPTYQTTELKDAKQRLLWENGESF